MKDIEDFDLFKVGFPAQPSLGKVNVSSWLKAQKVEGDTPVVI